MAFAAATFLFGLIGIIFILIMVSEVFLYLFTARPDDPSTGVGYSFFQLIRNGLAAFGIAFSTLSTYASLISSALIPLLTLSSSIFVLVILAEVNIAYQSQYMQVLDGKITKDLLPVYKNLVLPIANIVRVIYDSIWCWYNTYAASYRVLLYNFYNVLLDCTIPAWVPMTQSILDMFSGFGRSLVAWTGSGWQDDFDWQPILSAAGSFIANSSQPATCACGDLFFAFGYVAGLVKDTRLYYALQNAANAIIAFIRIIITLLYRLITFQIWAPPFGCDSSLPTPDLATCMSKRPPDLYQVFNLTCLAFTNASVFIDNSLELIVIQITGTNSDIIPNFVAPVGTGACSLLNVIENVVDLIWHVDLAFPFTTPRVHMLLRIKTYNTIGYLFSTMDLLEIVFLQIDANIIGNFGCTVTNIGRALIQLLDFAFEAVKVTGDDVLNGLGGTEIQNFIENYNYTLIKIYLERSAVCLDRAASNINDPVSKILRAIIVSLSQLLDMFIDLVSNAKRKRMEIAQLPTKEKRDIETELQKRNLIVVITTIIKPKWNDFKTTIRSLTIAIGNFFRQFEVRPGCVPLYDPFNPAYFGARIPIDGIFCAIGSTAQDGLYMLSGIIEILIDSFIAALEGQTLNQIMSQTNPNAPFNIDAHFFDRYEYFIESVSALFPNLFVYISSTVVTSCIETPNDKMTTLLNDVIRLLLFFVDLIVTVLKSFANLLTGSFDFCPDILVPVYNATLGRFVEAVLSLIDFFVCVGTTLGNSTGGTGDFKSFMEFVEGVFGRDGDFISIVCTIIDILKTVIQLFYILFTDPAKFFQIIGNALVSIFECIGDVIGGFFSAAFDVVANFFQQFASCTSDFFTQTIPGCLCQFVQPILYFLQLLCSAFGSSCSLSCTGSCSIPNSCNQFADANFGSIDFDSLADNFTDCVENVDFNISRRKRSEFSFRDVAEKNILNSMLSGLNTSVSLTFLEEVNLMAKRECGPLIPFAATSEMFSGDASSASGDDVDKWIGMIDESVLANLIQNNETLSRQLGLGGETFNWAVKGRASMTDLNIFATNSSFANATRFVYGKEFRNCLVSALSARMFEKYVLMINDPTLNVVPKLWWYDGYEGVKLLWKTISTVRLVVSYEFQRFKKFSENGAYNISNAAQVPFESWLQWIANNGYENDLFETRLGWWATQISGWLLYDSNSYRLNSNSTSGGFISFMLQTARTFFGRNGVYEVLSSVSDSMLDIGKNYNMTLATRNVQEMMSFSAWTIDPKLINMFSNLIGNITDPSTMIGNFTLSRNLRELAVKASRNTQAMRAVMSPLRLSKRIQQRMAWNDQGRPYDWRYGLIPSGTFYTHDAILEWQMFVIQNQTVIRQFSQPSSYSNDYYSSSSSLPLPPASTSSNETSLLITEKRSNLANITLCINNACLNCTWLEKVLDDFIDLFYLCIQDTEQHPVEINGDLIISSTQAGLLPAIRPDFWSPGNPSHLRKRDFGALLNDFYENGGNVTRLSSLWERYRPAPSLRRLFLNHETQEEIEENLELEFIEMVHGLRVYDESNPHVITARRVQRKRMLERFAEDIRKRDIGQPGNRVEGATRFEQLLNGGFTVTSFLFKLFEQVFQTFFDIDLRKTIITAMEDIVSRVETGDAGFEFWLLFLRRCNYFDNARCNVGRKGYGFTKALTMTMLIITIVIAILLGLALIPFVGSFSMFFVGLIPLFLTMFGYPMFQSLAYWSSPACPAFFPAPVLQNCLLDDAYVAMRDLYAPCINWEGIGLPGITTKECPPPFARCVLQSDFSQYVNVTGGATSTNCPAGTIYADQNERVFVDCTAAPYNFKDGLRNFFFFLNTRNSSLFEWLKSSSFSPVRYFFNLPFVASMNTFDFGPSGVPSDTWNSCQKLTTPNWIPLIGTIGSLGVAGLSTAILVAIGLFIIWLLFGSLAYFYGVLISSLTNYRVDMSHIESSTTPNNNNNNNNIGGNSSPSSSTGSQNNNGGQIMNSNNIINSSSSSNTTTSSSSSMHHRTTTASNVFDNNDS